MAGLFPVPITRHLGRGQFFGPAGKPPNVQVFSTTGTWNKPPGAKLVTISLIAAGGGSAGGVGIVNGAAGGGGGAGGGGFVTQTYLASALPASVVITLGLAGTPGVAGSQVQGGAIVNPTGGNNAGDSTFGTFLTAHGGQGGNIGGASSPGGTGVVNTPGLSGSTETGGTGGAGGVTAAGTAGGNTTRAGAGGGGGGGSQTGIIQGFSGGNSSNGFGTGGAGTGGAVPNGTRIDGSAGGVSAGGGAGVTNNGLDNVTVFTNQGGPGGAVSALGAGGGGSGGSAVTGSTVPAAGSTATAGAPQTGGPAQCTVTTTF